ncbi:TatD family hydrolase [Flavobacterium stagni]|uniref:TatD family deoxyribonuclease n=1 Tax=Flavobacterium stagni TaxID=2506421 RepID=A0A4Q1K839_9FLAO|nr:TatD family hydrolase [Flavobacterium stagni]RXR21456.1 TatD family deoxyribonuclease [Flavobacterium stagni]
MFNLHTHHYTATPNCIELVNQYPWEFDPAPPVYSIGIHPWFIDATVWPLHMEIVEQHLIKSGCLAIGECGLDKRIEVPFELQLQVFEAHLILAEQYQKPVVLHLVGAFQELIALKKQHRLSVPLIVHGFSKNAQLAQELVKHGFYLSFGKYLLRNPELKTAFLAVPENRIFLETDTIEESITDVYAKAAEYRNLDVSELERRIKRNRVEVFGGEERPL